MADGDVDNLVGAGDSALQCSRPDSAASRGVDMRRVDGHSREVRHKN